MGDALTFTQATVYAPLVLISLLYVPTFIYITFLSFKYYGLNNWFDEILNDPVYFIFPILTSMSFYGAPHSENKVNITGENKKYRNDHYLEAEQIELGNKSESISINEENSGSLEAPKKDKTDDVETISVIGIETISVTGTGTVDVETVSVLGTDDVEPVSKIETVDRGPETLKNSGNEVFSGAEQKYFSIKQSNMLYLLFLLGSNLCIFGDLWHQRARGINHF